MSFAKGSVSTERNNHRYIGIAPVSILAVNPSKKEFEEIFNTSLEEDPTYVSEITVGEDSHVESVRLDFVLRTIKDSCGIEITTRLPYYLRNEYRYNKDKTKIQVIDKYGRTCWVTIEQAKNHEIPIYSNGPANIDSDYRPAYYGEEDLTAFIKTYLNIPNVMRYVNNTWKIVDNPQDCEARLDNIKDYFNNDFSELKTVIALQPENKVKVLFGVRTSEDNRLFQTIYSQMVLRNSATKYTKLEADVKARKDAGAYANTVFEICDIKEYVVEATNFEAVDKPKDNPFAPAVQEDDLPFGNDEPKFPWE